ncbi:MAG: hypothetical protein LBP72_10960 [Dysgonamonadaceae bacterium]|jgi:hypothetical protein|nr:hypothetical protein [Dysgonamonadaceae bacterium]
MTKKILVLSVTLALLLSANLRAQVTIGALTAPTAGALLDLNRGATGGLLLSNVALPNLSVIPANTFVNISTEQDTNKELVGMIVYNTDATTGVGIYVWDGYDWIKPCAPPIPGPITFSGATICGGATFTAKIDSVKGATSYVWTLPAGLTGTSNDTIITITGAVDTYSAGSITVRAVSSCGGGTRRESTKDVTIVAIPNIPSNPSSNSGSSGSNITFSATPPANCTIDWYDALSGGNKIASGSPYSPTLTSTQTYFAESRNLTTGCVSATRLPVTGTVVIAGCDPLPAIPLISSANVDFASGSDVTTTSGLVFSPPIKIIGKGDKKTLASTSNSLIDYRDHTNATNTNLYGSWFTWCMVATYADVLCPSPWHVPSLDEFQTYYNAETNVGVTVKYGMHGWLLGGCAYGGSVDNTGPTGYYWSSTEDSSDSGYYALVNSSLFSPSSYTYRYFGFSLRCVR